MKTVFFASSDSRYKGFTQTNLVIFWKVENPNRVLVLELGKWIQIPLLPLTGSAVLDKSLNYSEPHLFPLFSENNNTILFASQGVCEGHGFTHENTSEIIKLCSTNGRDDLALFFFFFPQSWSKMLFSSSDIFNSFPSLFFFFFLQKMGIIKLAWIIVKIKMQ